MLFQNTHFWYLIQIFQDLQHSYQDILLPILPFEDDLYDFPILVILYYIPSHETGRQRIYFSTLHTLLCLYNHSDFVKMHMHNAWLLTKTKLNITLPEELFESWIMFYTKIFYLLNNCYTAIVILCTMNFIMNYIMMFFFFLNINLLIFTLYVLYGNLSWRNSLSENCTWLYIYTDSKLLYVCIEHFCCLYHSWYIHHIGWIASYTDCGYWRLLSLYDYNNILLQLIYPDMTLLF